MSKYLQQRGKTYYLRFRVPADLTSVFPEKEYLKSLKTKDKAIARLSSSKMFLQIQEVFTLKRYGFIEAQQAIDGLNNILNRQKVTTGSYTLKTAIAEYMGDKATGWTAKTKLEYEGYFKLILDVLGDVHIANVTRDTIRQLRDTLSKLPANLYKRFPNMSIDQVLSLEVNPPMSIATINKLLTLVGGLMRHCVAENKLSSNPVEGLKIQKKTRTDEERKAYELSDIKRIIVNLPAGRSERYWIPLIAMYSGMRLGEIVGLHVDDIKQVDGVTPQSELDFQAA